MKKLVIIIFVSLLALVSCQKDPEIPIVSLIVQDKAEAEWLNASLSGAAIANTKVEHLYLQISKDESFDSYSEAETQYENAQFKVSISNLTPQTTYYYRYRGENKLNSFTSDTIHHFRTKDFSIPIVTTIFAINVSGKKASLFGTVIFDCGKEISERGFEYGTDKDNLIKAVCDSVDFTKQLLHLEFNTQYYYRAYATSEIGTGYGEIKIFKTCDVVRFGSIKVDNITINSAQAEYSILSTGGLVLLRQGLQCWKNSGLDSTTIEANKDIKFTNLERNQQYQLRAFAETEDSCFYSPITTFTTKDGIIKLFTSTPSDIGYTSATLGGMINDDGGAAITERGICWSTHSLPSIADFKQPATNNSYTFAVSNLKDGTIYYVRAYAINQFGTFYGENKSFTTLAHEFIDLGLSVKWATCNIGAKNNYESGDRFTWGETQPTQDPDKNTDNKYKTGQKYPYIWTKYCTESDYGNVDNKTILELSDDAAHINWGGNWRMPTASEWQELIQNCSRRWTRLNNVEGCLVTGKNNNTIFLPCYTQHGDFYGYSICSYWSSSLCAPENNKAVCAAFANGSGLEGWITSDQRYSSLLIRPVCP